VEKKTFGIPVDLAASLIDGLGLQVAVETGTHLGHTAGELRKLVQDVWTMELSPSYVRRAKATYGDVGGMHFLEGSSPTLLPGVAKALLGPALYWLDAHWCGLDTSGVEAQCPVLAEIAALDSSPTAAMSCILIDDARLFLGGPASYLRKTDWPSFIEVVDALRSRHDRYVTVLLDVIIAGPPEARSVVEDFWQERCAREEARQRRSLPFRLAPTARAILPTGLYQGLRRRIVGY
jgi:hypothetical protein